MIFVVTVLSAWLLADFLTGIAHWAQDKVLVKATGIKFLDEIKRDNDRHHSSPGTLLRHTYWENVNTSVPLTIPICLGLIWLGAPQVLWLAVFFASFANIVHRLAHEPKLKLHPAVRWMQDTGLFISYDHHWVHHADADGLIEKQNTTVRYCPMTNWLNPILDRIGFWRLLERGI